MGLLQKIFERSKKRSQTPLDFWTWFELNNRKFFKVVSRNGNIQKDFFHYLSIQLEKQKGSIFYLTGMWDDNTAELILTADGSVKDIVFVEELVAAAPKIPGWKFTCLKPDMEIQNVNISMNGYECNSDNLTFFANIFPEYPDEIDITVVHSDLNDENSELISNGIYIFLDNYLGELNFAVTIDNLRIMGNDFTKELIPIEKLKSYLIWRQKEFIGKYEGLTRSNTDEDEHTIFEATLSNGKPALAVINTDLLNWEGSPSHPWLVTTSIVYNGSENNGLPDERTSSLLEEIEGLLMIDLKDFDGNLYIGRQTAENVREIYFACKDFRKAALVASKVRDEYSGDIDISFDIFKDKYWQFFNHFRKV